MEIPPVEHTIAVQLCPRSTAAWLGNPCLRLLVAEDALLLPPPPLQRGPSSSPDTGCSLEQAAGKRRSQSLPLPGPWSTRASGIPGTGKPYILLDSSLRDALPSGSDPCALLRCPTAVMLVVPLVPLVQSPGAWPALPRPACWLTRTIRLSYAIQFARRPPNFRGIRFITVLNQDTPVWRVEITVLLVKDAIEPVPPVRVLQPLLHCTQ